MRSTSTLLTAALGALFLNACTAAEFNQGEAGPLLSLRFDAEGPGENCPQGGTAIHSGTDTNGDGALGDEEITATAYMCDKSLLETADEPAGANCPLGGKAIKTGSDANGDGTLQDEEVAATTYVCNDVSSTSGVLQGSLQITGADDIAKAQGYTEVTGSVFVLGGSSVDLPNLTTIGGELQILYTSGLTDLSGLSAVTSIGGGVQIGGNKDLESLNGLDGVTGTIGGNFSLFDNTALTNISALSGVTAIGGSIEISNNSLLPALTGLENVTKFEGNFTVTGNAALTSLQGIAGADSNFGANVTINQNPVLTDFVVPVKTVGRISMSNGTLQAQAGMNVAGNIQRLTFSNLVGLTEETSSLYIGYNPDLQEVTFADLQETPYFIEMYGNEVLTTVSLPELTDVGSGFYFNGNDAAGFTVLAPKLDTVQGTVSYQDNEGSTTLNWPLLRLVGGRVEVRLNDALTTFTAPTMEAITNQFYLRDNPLLTTVNVDALDTITCNSGGTCLWVENNGISTSCANSILGGLIGFSGTTNIAGNTGSGACHN